MAYPSKLTPESILRAALSLLDPAGPESLNMRTLAARLGVRASSLYRHYPDRAALLGAVEEHITLDLHAVVAEASQRWGAPVDRLRAAAHAYLTYAVRHPHLYTLLLAPRAPAAAPPGPGKDLWTLVLGLVGAVSGTPDDTARTVTLWAFLHGFVLLTLSGQLGLSGDQGGFRVGLETLIAGFAAANGAGSGGPTSA